MDEKNPGRSEALNPLPVDRKVADRLKSTLDAIENYNAELPAVIAANTRIEKDLSEILGNDHAPSPVELNQRLGHYGIEDTTQFQELLSQDAVNESALTKFAEKMNLSPSTASVYLNLRFGK